MDNKAVQPSGSAKTVDSLLSPVDASIDIIISDDGQSAYLGITPPANGGRDVTYAQLAAELEKRRVVSGILTDVLKAMADKPVYNNMTTVAQGSLPVQGSDAKLTFHFSFNREIRPRERSDGTVDYRDLGLIEQVTAGQELCTLTPANKGIPGKTVLGKVILPDSVRSFGLPLGKNTKLSADKLSLLAAINGSVEYLNGKINVNNVFSVNGDVCIATGNIDFDGSVVINGDVLAGFFIKATGNINIVGNVEGSVLEAGGDIKIVAGLVGQSRGRAVCGGNFKALFVENAEIFAKGDVTADVFMHSQVKCSGSVIAEGRRGAIIGGSFIIGKDVKALTVDTQSGVVTTFELGVDPTINERIKFIKERIIKLNTELPKLNQIVQLLYPLKLAEKLPQDKVEMLDKAIATKDHYETELADINKERETLAAASEAPVNSQFVCKRELYFGTKVSIGQVPFVVPGDVIRCKIYLSPAREISMVSLS